MLKRFFTVLSAIAVTALLSACNDSSSRRPAATTPVVPASSVVYEVFHASQDAPEVEVTAGSDTVKGIDFGEGAFFDLLEGSVDVTVDGVLPGGPATVIGPATIAGVDGQRITVIALNEVTSIEPLVLVDDQPAVDAGEVRVRIVHAASTAPMVDVYVTDMMTDITTVAPLGTFSFKDTLGPVTVPEGEYRIQVTPAGDPTAVVYDSGAVGLAGGSDLVIAAIANVATGSAAIELAVLTGSDILRIVDAASTANVRVVHASADAPAVDVVANDDFAAPAVPALAFPQVTGYLELVPGDINVKVVPAGATTPVVIDADLSLEAATSYTVLAIGELAAIQARVLVDRVRPIATEAQLRIVHASALAGEVDLYLVAPGTDLESVEPNFTAVSLGGLTGYLSLAAGDYDVAVTPTGDKTPAIGPATISLEAGKIYTAAARDEVGGTLPLGLILFDDFL